MGITHSQIDTWLRTSGRGCLAPRILPDGAEVGPFRVLGLLGCGASAEVYRARREEDGTVVALKVLREADAASRERLRREAAMLSEHPHPALPRFVGTGETDNPPWLALEELFPGDLPCAPRDVERFLLALCEALAHLHALGFVHRDIKPSNILRRVGGAPVLIDLGLVKRAEPAARDTAGAVPSAQLSVIDGRAVGHGTPGYAAPEQFSGGDLTPAADVYALGILALRCFGGHPPRLWRSVLRRATAPLPADRQPDAAAFARALRCRRAPVFALVAAALAALALWRLSPQSAPSLSSPSSPPPAAPALAAAAALEAAAPPELREIATFGALGEHPHISVSLGGRTISLAEPFRLGVGAIVEIEGPGRIDGVLEGATNDLVILRNATLVNRTEDPDPAHSPRVRLEAGGYLLLPEVLSLHARDWAEPYDEPDPAAPKPDDCAVRFGHGLDPDLRRQLLRERGLADDERLRAAEEREVPAPELVPILLPNGPTNVLCSVSSLHPWRPHPTEPGVIVCDLAGGFGESWIRLRTEAGFRLSIEYKKNYAGAADHGGRGGVFELVLNDMVLVSDATDGKFTDCSYVLEPGNWEFPSGGNPITLRFRCNSYTIPGHFNGIVLRAVPTQNPAQSR